MLFIFEILWNNTELDGEEPINYIYLYVTLVTRLRRFIDIVAI